MRSTTLRESIESGLIKAKRESYPQPWEVPWNTVLRTTEEEVRHWLANIFQTEMHHKDTAQAKRLWELIKGGENVD